MVRGYKLALALAVPLLATGLRSADVPVTDVPETSRVIVTGQAESESLTSPSTEKAAEQKGEIPGGFTLRNAEEITRGRLRILRIC